MAVVGGIDVLRTLDQPHGGSNDRGDERGGRGESRYARERCDPPWSCRLDINQIFERQHRRFTRNPVLEHTEDRTREARVLLVIGADRDVAARTGDEEREFARREDLHAPRLQVLRGRKPFQ